MIIIFYIGLICLSLINGFPHPFEECNCQNDGECVELFNGDKGCNCLQGFFGKYCELTDEISLAKHKDKNPGEVDYKIQCFNNGTIYYDKNGKLKCKCKPNLTGAKCEFMLPSSTECTPNPCFNGGVCQDLYPGYRCTCPPAYTGLRCETVINDSPSNCAKPCDPCSQNPCSINGQCFNSSCNAICICNPSYTGTFCDTIITTQPITTTTTTTCAPPATTTTPCQNPTSTITTTTTTTTASAPCMYNCDPCATNPCTTNGVCHNFSCSVYCECNVGYTGQYCEDVIPLPQITTTTPNPQCNACPAQNACSNNGECFTLSCEAYCVCNAGWTGDNCNIPIEDPASTTTTTTPFPPNCDPCAQNPCSSNSQCTNVNCSAYCVCNPGYTGANCDIILQTGPVTTTTSTSTPCPAPQVAVTASIPYQYQPSRCNFSIGLFNDGAFTTRFKVEYKIDGITQPLLTSQSLAIIGQSTFNTIPWYSTDIVVTVEVLGWHWFTVKEDTNISTATYCTKCYKTWGTITGVKIDFLKC